MNIKQSDLDRFWNNLHEFQLTPVELILILDGVENPKPEELDRFASNGQRGKEPVTTKQVFDHFLNFDCGWLLPYASVVATFIRYADTTSDAERAWCGSLIRSSRDNVYHSKPNEKRCLKIVGHMKTLGIKLWSGAPKETPSKS